MTEPVDQIKIIRKGHRQERYWRECWNYRELVYFLARRDFIIKYRQTLAGILWLIARPLQQVFIFTVVFGVIAQLPSGSVHYPVLVMSGAVTWQFFSSIVNQANTALINNHNLITKVNFPRILLPIGTIVPNILDLLINLLALAALMAWYGDLPTWRLVLLPLPICLAALLGLGMGLWFSSLSVRYRDFAQMAGFLLQFLFLLSPIGYASSVLKERLGVWIFLYDCNPLVGIIDFIRWCALPEGAGPFPEQVTLITSLLVAGFLVISGQYVFRRLERTFADVI